MRRLFIEGERIVAVLLVLAFALAGVANAISGERLLHLRSQLHADDRPLVSVIVPTTRQRAAFVVRAVESIVKKQTYENVEVVIVDDGAQCIGAGVFEHLGLAGSQTIGERQLKSLYHHLGDQHHRRVVRAHHPRQSRQELEVEEEARAAHLQKRSVEEVDEVDEARVRDEFIGADGEEDSVAELAEFRRKQRAEAARAKFARVYHVHEPEAPAQRRHNKNDVHFDDEDHDDASASDDDLSDFIEPEDLAEPTGDRRVQYICVHGWHSIGFKRNLAVSYAHGQIIVFWDDDDMFAPDRIEQQLSAMLQLNYDIVALPFDLILDLRAPPATLYQVTTAAAPHYGTLMFRKALFLEHGIRFEDASLGEDYGFALRAQHDADAKFGVLAQGIAQWAYVRHNNTWWEFSIEYAQKNMDKVTAWPQWLQEQSVPLIEDLLKYGKLSGGDEDFGAVRLERRLDSALRLHRRQASTGAPTMFDYTSSSSGNIPHGFIYNPFAYGLTPFPTMAPTARPTLQPTALPTQQPTTPPTLSPTLSPVNVVTAAPTASPTLAPTGAPTPPTDAPTLAPSASPTPPLSPTPAPTPPTSAPTAAPNFAVPTASPTEAPTLSPTPDPIGITPTPAPTRDVTAPTSSPTLPTQAPTPPTPTQAPTPPTPPPTFATEAPTLSPTPPTPPPTSPPTQPPTPAPTKDPFRYAYFDPRNPADLRRADSLVRRAERDVAVILRHGHKEKAFRAIKRSEHVAQLEQEKQK